MFKQTMFFHLIFCLLFLSDYRSRFISVGIVIEILTPSIYAKRRIYVMYVFYRNGEKISEMERNNYTLIR